LQNKKDEVYLVVFIFAAQLLWRFQKSPMLYGPSEEIRSKSLQ